MTVLMLSSSASAWEFNQNPISDHNDVDISTSNGDDYHVGFRCAGGGLNALHITSDPSEPYGQFTSVSEDSGTFYLADTGGRGYFDRAVLMVAIKKPTGDAEISEDLMINLQASGYQWESTGELNRPPELSAIRYISDSLDRSFDLSSVTYGPQKNKPAGESDHSIMNGQSSSDEFYLFFVDTGVGILGRNSGLSDLTDNGMARIDYSIENYRGETIAFNVYGYAVSANAINNGIAWTNKLDGSDRNKQTCPSGYTVMLGFSGNNGEFGRPDAIDYGDERMYSAGHDIWVPEFGNLNITSDPEGAVIYLDGVDTGKITNASFVDLPAGEYNIRLVRPGYDPAEDSGVRVDDRYLTSRHYNLTPATGSCRVASDLKGARIFIDGRETLCYTDWTFQDIRVGMHNISVEKSGYNPLSENVCVDAVNETEVFFRFSDGAGVSAINYQKNETVQAQGQEQISEIQETGKKSAECSSQDETGEGLIGYIWSLFAEITGDNSEDTAPVTNTPDPGNLSESSHEEVSEEVAEVTVEHPVPVETQSAITGSIYVASYPEGYIISVDGRETDYITPHLIYGLKEGNHKVSVRLPRRGSASDDVWVYAGESSVAEMDFRDDTHDVSVTVLSQELNGGNFSVNGELPYFSLPSEVSVEPFKTYLTYNDGIYYYSRFLPVLDGDETISLNKFTGFGKISITSVPEGASIYIDGINTGYTTPAVMDNVGDGHHKLMVTKAGYLPVKKEINLVNTNDDIDLIENFVLDEFASGSLSVTSDPAGCSIYLRNSYTGQVTPYTFENVPLGTYDVGVMFNRTVFKDKEVTVLPVDTSEVAEISFNL